MSQSSDPSKQPFKLYTIEELSKDDTRYKSVRDSFYKTIEKSKHKIIQVSICVYVYSDKHIHRQTHTCMPTYVTYIRTYICKCIHTYTYIYTYIHTCIHT